MFVMLMTIHKIGTLLAYLASASLVGSVTFSYIQCLWNSLKTNEMSIQTIDAAFDALQSLLSFRNFGLLLNFKLISFIAIIAWSVLDHSVLPQ